MEAEGAGLLDLSPGPGLFTPSRSLVGCHNLVAALLHLKGLQILFLISSVQCRSALNTEFIITAVGIL